MYITYTLYQNFVHTYINHFLYVYSRYSFEFTFVSNCSLILNNSFTEFRSTCYPFLLNSGIQGFLFKLILLESTSVVQYV